MGGLLQLCAPMALFFVDSEKQLRPLAIQLFQEPGPDNPVSLSVNLNSVIYSTFSWSSHIFESVPNDWMIRCETRHLFAMFCDSHYGLHCLKIIIFCFHLFSQIFLPTDHSLTWALVKMWYNSADAAYHQSLTHLGQSHMCVHKHECIVTYCHTHSLSFSHTDMHKHTLSLFLFVYKFTFIFYEDCKMIQSYQR